LAASKYAIFLTPAIGSTRRCVIEEHLVFGLGRDIAQEMLVLAWKVLKDESKMLTASRLNCVSARYQ
jgi:hypothetical protein